MADLYYPRLAHPDSEIPSLPLESLLDFPVLIDPAGGICLDEAERRGNRKVRPELHQQVNMIWHAADLQENAPLATEDSSDVLIERFPEAIVDQRDTSFRGKDDVV